MPKSLQKLQKNVLTFTRIFDAPRELVWKAWTDPELVMRWWGPKNITTPVATIDLRVGGKYLYCMRSSDVQDFWSTGVFRKIVKPERIVITDSFSDEKGNVVPASHYGMTWDLPLEVQERYSLTIRTERRSSPLRKKTLLPKRCSIR